MPKNIVMGVDVGGSGIKGGLVDLDRGEMVTERFRFDTPDRSTPAAVANTFEKLLKEIGDYKGPIGVGFPAVVVRNVAKTAANVSDKWIGTDIAKTFGQKTKNPIRAINDADAAGLASMHYGIGKPLAKDGQVLMITIGTGLGAAMFNNGELVPNFELGSVFLKGHKKIAEQYISNRIRKDTDMNWKEFGKKLNEYLSHVDGLLNPDLIILGGGGSKHFLEYRQYLRTNAEVRPAVLKNTAGTIGAALYATLPK